MMRTANPTLNDKIFLGTRAMPGAEVMTLEGTVNKTLLSVLITIAAAYWTWNTPQWGAYYVPFMIVALIMAFVITFKRTLAPTLVPLYAALQGFMLGSISVAVNTVYPGIVFEAVSLTFGTLFCLLMAYKSRLIKPSENFKLGIVAATGAIFFIYLISLVLSLFGMQMSFLHDSSPFSIAISGVVVVIAALNLVLDFDFIETAAARGDNPKYMEWFGAFGLLVTLIWLYVEILRLLMKLRSRD